MALQISIQYKGQPLTYEVTVQEDKIYQLRLTGGRNSAEGIYIPEKIIIRRKGKIWISDMDNYDELIEQLTREIIQFDPEIAE
ncbi:MAG TPA: hypothetical protein VHK91_10665 [Flavisolibacter sp.]|jgi:hypothetical protein|nr:hypothetical protein [Flavisolibacter sp.]